MVNSELESNNNNSKSNMTTYAFIVIIISCILLMFWYYFLYNIPRKALQNYTPSNLVEKIMYPFVNIYYLIFSIAFFVYPVYILYNSYEIYKN